MEIFRKILAFDFGYKDTRVRVESLESIVAASPGSPSTAETAGGTQPRADRYRTEGLLGSGKLGDVYRGTDTELGRPIAVRRLREAPREIGKADRFVRAAAAT